jgi:hypothetical protein
MSTSRVLPAVRRTTVGLSLMLGIALAGISVLLQPKFPDDPSEYVESIAGSASAHLGLQMFVASQVFWAVGLIGLGHAASRRSPVFGSLAALFSALGAFGHAVYGGASLVTFAIAEYAADSGDMDAALAAFSSTQGGAFIPYLACGLLGTILGMILLAVALIRSRIAPLWVPIALIAWTVIEFVLPNFVTGVWVTYTSLVLGAIAFVGAGVAVLRGGPGAWTTMLEGAPDADAEPSVVVNGARETR